METPALYAVEVGHVRYQRIRRTLRHRTYLWLVDLDHLPRLPWYLRPAARFRSADHLGDPDRPIRANVEAYLATHGVRAGGRIVMLAHAYSLGYVFNPLTLFWCHDPAGDLVCVVAEVHNTYGERHCYLLRPDPVGRAEVDKQFYVSPFLSVTGSYRMTVPPPGETLAVTVGLHQDGHPALVAMLRGDRRPASTRQLLRVLVRYPAVTYRTAALIRRHGVALWARRLPVVRHPDHVPQQGVR
jgi:uncharacterized protein